MLKLEMFFQDSADGCVYFDADMLVLASTAIALAVEVHIALYGNIDYCLSWKVVSTIALYGKSSRSLPFMESHLDYCLLWKVVSIIASYGKSSRMWDA